MSALLIEGIGWRGTCLVYAGLHIAVSLPLCLIALPKVAVGTLHPAASEARAKAPAGPVFWRLATEGMVLSLISTIVSVHLIVLLQAQGVALAAAVALGALIGPAQVGARMIEMATGGRHPAIWTLVTSTRLIAPGVAGMQAGLPMAAALVVYGAGNGSACTSSGPALMPCNGR